jgi:uncharacterized protein YjiK/methionine-rich copper-binding protein CopC
MVGGNFYVSMTARNLNLVIASSLILRILLAQELENSMKKPINKLTQLSTALCLVLALAGCGTDDAPLANQATNAPVGAPTLSFVSPQETLDLNNYSLVAKYRVPVGSGTNLLGSEVSAVTYNKDTDTLFILGDNGTSVTQINKKGQLIDTMTLPADASKPQGTYYYDPEGLAYIGGGKFVMVEERYRQITRFTYAPGTTLNPTTAQTVKLGTTIGNVGLEGVSFDPSTNGYILVKEKTPLGVFQTSVNFEGNSASNGSATTVDSTNLFDPALANAVLDFGDVFALANTLPSTAPDYSHLIVLSQESGKILKMTRAGAVLSALDIDVSAQHEGITFDTQLNMYVTNELGTAGSGEELWVYTPTKDKTAVGLASNLYLTFATEVGAGSGSIVVSDGAGDTRNISVTDATQVKFAGKTVVVNPTANLIPGKTYTITYAQGVVKDSTGAATAALEAAAALSFKTVGDITNPRLVSTTPADSALNVTGSRIVLTFDENVKAATGTITISNGTDDTRVIQINDLTQVTISEKTIDINPSADLKPATNYKLTLTQDAVVDLGGNGFVGIPSDTALKFTTAGSSLPTALVAGDILFIAANADATDAFAFVLMRAVNAGTTIYFSDRDSLIATNESAFKWVADRAYVAGSVVTIQTSPNPPIASAGSTEGLGGGISGTSETIFAFQGAIAGLTNSTAGALTVTTYLAAINVAGTAGPLDATLLPLLTPSNAFLSFTADNVKYNGSLVATDLSALRALIANPSNWVTDDVVAYPIVNNSLFP